MVSRSSADSMVSDRYGWVWKKSKAMVATTAVSAPARRPPPAAAATTTTTRMRAMLVLSIVPRTATSTPAMAMAANGPMAEATSRSSDRVIIW